MSQMKIAVIGSNSFSGSNFVNFALSNGASVLGLGRKAEPAMPFRPYSVNLNFTNFRFAQASLLGEGDTLAKELQAYQPNYVVNFAAQSMVAESWEWPEDWYEANALGVAKLAKVLQKLKSLQRYVHVTTPEVYGSTENWISEGAPFNPSTPYAISRAAGDWHLRALNKEFGFPVVFTRAANVYGPGQQLYRVVPKAFLTALSNAAFPLHGGGYSSRSFIHIEDVSIATWKIMLEGKLGEDYHISTNQLISIRDLVMKIYQMADSKSLELEEVSDRVGKDKGYFLSSTKLRSELGWTPQKSLDEGLAETFSWVKTNWQTLKSLPWSYSHSR